LALVRDRSNALLEKVMTHSRYLVTSSACGAGDHRRVAVAEVDLGFTGIILIRKRHLQRGVIRFVRIWEHCFVGKTMDCAYQSALRAADLLRSRLEAEDALWERVYGS